MMGGSRFAVWWRTGDSYPHMSLFRVGRLRPGDPERVAVKQGVWGTTVSHGGFYLLLWGMKGWLQSLPDFVGLSNN